jgi:hypothetical protein
MGTAVFAVPYTGPSRAGVCPAPSLRRSHAHAFIVSLCAGAEARSGLAPFAKLQRSAVEALRYRAEDIARSLTRSAIKEVRSSERQPGRV